MRISFLVSILALIGSAALTSSAEAYRDYLTAEQKAQLEKIPYMLVLGEKERDAGSVAVRDRVDGDLGPKPLAEVIDMFKKEVEAKRIRQVSTASAGLDDRGAKFGE